MEIREIIYVNKVAELKNLTHAAKALHITQPSLTQSIQSIEHRLGVQLFNRSRRGVTLTQAGQQFIADSSNVIKAYNAFLSKAQHYKGGAQTHFIGLYKLSHTTPINNAIMNFLASHSADNYILKVESIDDLEKMLLAHQLDLAIIKYTPLHQRHQKLSYDLLFQEKLHVLVSASNPLAQKTSLTIEELIGNKLITSAKDEYPYKMTEALLQEAGVKLDVHTYINYYNMDMIMNLVKNDFGVTFATRDVCEHFSTPGIRAIPLAHDVSYDICIVQNEANSDISRNGDLIDFIHKALSEVRK